MDTITRKATATASFDVDSFVDTLDGSKINPSIVREWLTSHVEDISTDEIFEVLGALEELQARGATDDNAVNGLGELMGDTPVAHQYMSIAR